jgi:hypothetical protein
VTSNSLPCVDRQTLSTWLHPFSHHRHFCKAKEQKSTRTSKRILHLEGKVMTLSARQASQKELISSRKEVSKIFLTSLYTVVGIDVNRLTQPRRALYSYGSMFASRQARRTCSITGRKEFFAHSHLFALQREQSELFI